MIKKAVTKLKNCGGCAKRRAKLKMLIEKARRRKERMETMATPSGSPSPSADPLKQM